MIELIQHHRNNLNQITIEEFQKRRIRRRRRVADRKLKAAPLFAVEEMQGEFPGYSYDEFIQDITRKRRKYKSIRHIKTRAFDWKYIAEIAPHIFEKCRVRTPTKAILYGRHNDIDFTVVIRSCWYDGQSQQRLDTMQFLRLFQGSLNQMLKHPAVLAYKTIQEENSLFPEKK